MPQTGPSFICIGAQKAGTTWLAKQLKAHPEIWIPPQKELHYFDRSDRYSSARDLSVISLQERLQNDAWVEQTKKRLFKSLDNRNPVMTKWWSHYLFSEYSDEWYLSLFDSCPGKVTGELTPAYSILTPKDVMQMAKLLPETKIIFLIRNPVLRAWSMLRFASQQGKHINFEDVDSLVRETNARGQAHRSNYARTLDNYAEAFGKDRILVGFYDAIASNPQDLISQVLSFLNVDTTLTEKMNLGLVSNVSPKVEMPKVVFEHLREKYAESIDLLAEKYGSYCSIWKDFIHDQHNPDSHRSLVSAFNLSSV